jgi:hypothetical protein
VTGGLVCAVLMVLWFLGSAALQSMPRLDEWADAPAATARAYSDARAAWWRDCLDLVVFVVTPVLTLLALFVRAVYRLGPADRGI